LAGHLSLTKVVNGFNDWQGLRDFGHGIFTKVFQATARNVQAQRWFFDSDAAGNADY
jgi:hypothetical protein